MKGVKNRDSLISELDKKILDYLNKNNSCYITELVNKLGSGNQHLKRHLDYLLKVKLIIKVKRDKSCQKDYFLNEDKRKEIDFILGLPKK